MLDVSVVIVSFNTASLLADCLDSVYGKHTELVQKSETGSDRSPLARNSEPTIPQEVIVVDNASTDGSRDMVSRRFPQVVLIANEDNRGFAAANNQAMQIASGRHVLLLNSDTLVLADAIPKLAGFLDQNPAVAVASAQLQNPDGTHQHSAFRFPSLLMTFFDFFPINHRLSNSRLNGRYPVPHDDRPVEIDHPLGACMMIRRQVIDEVGMFDEQFFMYCEEIDWCLRMKKKGWRLYCLPAARIVHYGGQSARQIRGAMYAELFKSRARLNRKHHSYLFCLAARLIMKLGFWREGRRAERRFRAGSLDADGLGQELGTLKLARLAVDSFA
ncbi:MAG: glycosyltransferase family 2 protein [Dehalococcoidia bacterium]|nr:glycosyltransferase family 2 protein [Dehalococcoidia bacterium]